MLEIKMFGTQHRLCHYIKTISYVVASFRDLVLLNESMNVLFPMKKYILNNATYKTALGGRLKKPLQAASA